MYFWKLSALKRELAAAHLGEWEALLYLLWLGGLATAGYALPIEDPNLWDHLDSALAVAIFLLGAIYLYRCNGGASGTDFLGRYISLNWVFGLRFYIPLLALVLPILLLVDSVLPDGLPDESTPWQSAMWVVIEAVYYWRLGQHFSDIQPTSSA